MNDLFVTAGLSVEGGLFAFSDIDVAVKGRETYLRAAAVDLAVNVVSEHRAEIDSGGAVRAGSSLLGGDGYHFDIKIG